MYKAAQSYCHHLNYSVLQLPINGDYNLLNDSTSRESSTNLDKKLIAPQLLLITQGGGEAV